VSSAADLKTRTVKELAEMARKHKVHGWHEMRKDQLVYALLRQARTASAKRNGVHRPAAVLSKNGHAKNGSTSVKSATTNGHCKNGSAVVPAKVGAVNGQANAAQAKNGAAAVLEKPKSSTARNGNAVALLPAEKQILREKKELLEKGPKPRTANAERRLQQIKARLAEAKDLAFHTVQEERNGTRDRLVVMVRDPYWLHVYWELSRRSIQRAEMAMGQHWHAARPVLRLHEVSRNGTTSAARQTVRDIEIHGGVSNWYVDVQNPPKSYQLEIGYLAPGNRFFSLARSNVVSTPPPGSSDNFDRNWAAVAKECDRVYAMTTGSNEQEGNGDLKDVFEEHMHRTMGESSLTQFGPGAGGSKQNFRFQIDTELIVHGVTHPDARVTLRGEPVRLRPDGSFAVRFSLPDRRHVLPVVANSSDGAEQRTIVLAIDRNTKVMEPVVRDPGE